MEWLHGAYYSEGVLSVTLPLGEQARAVTHRGELLNEGVDRGVNRR